MTILNVSSPFQKDNQLILMMTSWKLVFIVYFHYQGRKSKL